MQMVEINSKNVDSITREGKTYHTIITFDPLAFNQESCTLRRGSAPLRRPWSRSIRNF